MKRDELLELVKCCVCKNPFGSSGLPFFYKITIERYGVDVDAVRRQDGLAAILGGNKILAGVMGPDEDMASLVDGPKTFTVCETCSLDQQVIVAFLCEGEGA